MGWNHQLVADWITIDKSSSVAGHLGRFFPKTTHLTSRCVCQFSWPAEDSYFFLRRDSSNNNNNNNNNVAGTGVSGLMCFVSSFLEGNILCSQNTFMVLCCWLFMVLTIILLSKWTSTLCGIKSPKDLVPVTRFVHDRHCPAPMCSVALTVCTSPRNVCTSPPPPLLLLYTRMFQEVSKWGILGLKPTY